MQTVILEYKGILEEWETTIQEYSIVLDYCAEVEGTNAQLEEANAQLGEQLACKEVIIKHLEVRSVRRSPALVEPKKSTKLPNPLEFTGDREPTVDD